MVNLKGRCNLSTKFTLINRDVNSQKAIAKVKQIKTKIKQKLKKTKITGKYNESEIQRTPNGSI